MANSIIDGTGRGYQARVTSGNRLSVSSIAVPFPLYVNTEPQQFYSIIVSITPTGAADCFLYIENTDPDECLFITSLSICCVTQAETITVKVDHTGTRNAAAAIIPVNRRIGSGNTAVGTFEQGVDLAGGAATLTAGAVIDQFYIPAGVVSLKRRWQSAIILNPHKSLTLWAGTGNAAILATLGIGYHEDTHEL